MLSPVGLCQWARGTACLWVTLTAGLSPPLGASPLPQLLYGSLQMVELGAWPSGCAGPAPEPRGHGPGSQGPQAPWSAFLFHIPASSGEA